MEFFALATETARQTFPAHEKDKEGPRPCCGEYAQVTICTGITDTFLCPVCDRVFTAPCRLIGD